MGNLDGKARELDEYDHYMGLPIQETILYGGGPGELMLPTGADFSGWNVRSLPGIQAVNNDVLVSGSSDLPP